MIAGVPGISVNVAAALFKDGPDGTRRVFYARGEQWCDGLPSPVITNGHWLFWGQTADSLAVRLGKMVAKWAASDYSEIAGADKWVYSAEWADTGGDAGHVMRRLLADSDANVPAFARVLARDGAPLAEADGRDAELQGQIIILRPGPTGRTGKLRHKGATRFVDQHASVKATTGGVGIDLSYFAALDKLGLRLWMSAGDPHGPIMLVRGDRGIDIVEGLIMPVRL